MKVLSFQGGIKIVKVELETSTVAVLIAGLYCLNHNVNALAIPESIYLEIAEKLEYFIPNWDYNKISFEEWVDKCLLIYPKVLFDDETLKDIQKTTLYWERDNGNAILIISMDIQEINS